MLGKLGQTLIPPSGAVPCPAATPSWIVRLNPVLVRCHGPGTCLGLDYQEELGGCRLLGEVWRWCFHGSHPCSGNCSCWHRGSGAAPEQGQVGSARIKSLLPLFLWTQIPTGEGELGQGELSSATKVEDGDLLPPLEGLLLKVLQCQT